MRELLDFIINVKTVKNHSNVYVNIFCKNGFKLVFPSLGNECNRAWLLEVYDESGVVDYTHRLN